jgi:hypothetical protein
LIGRALRTDRAVAAGLAVAVIDLLQVAKVRGEFSLTALAYNLRRVLNIVELPKLIAALPA